jgi:hypothetical protein
MAATGLAGLEHILHERLTPIAMIRAASDVPMIVITAQDDDPTMVKALDGGTTTTSSSPSAPIRWRPGSGRSCAAAGAT